MFSDETLLEYIQDLFAIFQQTKLNFLFLAIWFLSSKKLEICMKSAPALSKTIKLLWWDYHLPTGLINMRPKMAYFNILQGKNGIVLHISSKIGQVEPETAAFGSLEVSVEPRVAAVEHVAAPVEPV